MADIVKPIPGPIAQAADRLADAEDHLQDAMIAYHDPPSFQKHYHASLQELRNSTFILQGVKSVIPDFNLTYPAWQTWMKSEPLLAWANKARVQVVHISDLEFHSRADVGLQNNYLQDAPFPIDFSPDPLLSSKEIASLTRARIKLTSDLPKYGILVLHRMWKENSLPNFELADALLRCIFVLYRLMQNIDRGHLPDSVSDNDRITECQLMSTFLDPNAPSPIQDTGFQDIYLDLATGSTLKQEYTTIDSDPKIDKAAHDRYKDALPPLPKQAPQSLTELAHFYMSQARALLKTDGYHQPMAMLHQKSIPVQMIQLRFDNNSEKYLTWNSVAKSVHETQADCVVVIAESWVAQLDNRIPFQRPEDRLDRQEILTVDAIDAHGEEICLSVKIGRFGEDIILAPTVQMKGKDSYYLEPIRKIWAGGG